MHTTTARTSTIRNANVAAAASAALMSFGFGNPAHAAIAKGPFNCELGSTALPDDRWSSCASSTIDYCDLGANLLPDDRWAHCASN